MLSPTEVAEQKFRKTTFGGYEMLAVDNFLETLTQDYKSLYNENISLKNKLRELVDAVSEYRNVEESMRSVLLAAQKKSEEILKKASEQADGLILKAQDEALALSKRLREENDREMRRRELLKREMTRFSEIMADVLSRQIDWIRALPGISPSDLAGGSDQLPDRTSDDVDRALRAGAERLRAERLNREESSSGTVPPGNPHVPGVSQNVLSHTPKSGMPPSGLFTASQSASHGGTDSARPMPAMATPPRGE